MAKDSFNKEINTYLDKRRKDDSSGLKRFIPSRRKQSEVSELYPQLKENEIHVIKRESFLSRLFKNRKKKDSEEEIEKEEDIVTEIKDETTQKTFDLEEEEIDKEIIKSPTLKERIKRFFSKIKGESYPVNITERIVYEDFTQEARLKNELEDLERKKDELDVQINDIEHQKKIIMKRFISSFEKTKREIEVYNQMKKENEFISSEDYKDLENDLKEVSKITAMVIKNLGSRKIDSFKNTEEFHKFKEIIQRRKLVKE
jgi:hypothetical protein